jgi:ABC-type nitrate/sulfonate/bicarbonate transport system ATPase subunit
MTVSKAAGNMNAQMTDQEVTTAASPADSIKLTVSHVSKHFHLSAGTRIDAVKDVSFDVHENELCVLLGPSGCGKSTVLRMVAGLEEPSEGRLSLDGREILGPGRDRGMVFQSYTSFDWLTVQQNVEYGLRLNGVNRAGRRERAAHFIDLVNLTKFRDAYPSQLSGGMKQRVAIARTLANDPAILLMDEPFGALDAETRWTMQELLIRIVDTSKTTVLMVTHDIEEAIFLANRIIFMSRHPGRVRENIAVEFKAGKQMDNKEAVIDLEHSIMQMMREEGRDKD